MYFPQDIRFHHLLCVKSQGCRSATQDLPQNSQGHVEANGGSESVATQGFRRSAAPSRTP